MMQKTSLSILILLIKTGSSEEEMATIGFMADTDNKNSAAIKAMIASMANKTMTFSLAVEAMTCWMVAMMMTPQSIQAEKTITSSIGPAMVTTQSEISERMQSMA